MSAVAGFHDMLEQYNVLKMPTAAINEYFRSNPNVYKAALLVNHVFRAIAMAAFCAAMPFAIPVNIAICFVGSLFYRLTVETNCAFKFALPAFAGSLAIPLAYTALTSLIGGVAFASLSAFGIAFVSLIPLVAYVTYIVLTVDDEVNNRCS